MATLLVKKDLKVPRNNFEDVAKPILCFLFAKFARKERHQAARSATVRLSTVPLSSLKSTNHPLSEWYSKLYQKPANYELKEAESRQMLYDLESSYNIFFTALKSRS
eukprot:1161698-Pelagomonas_calceolata.AAC.12